MCQHRAWPGVSIPNVQGLGNEGVWINRILYKISLLRPGEGLSQSKRYLSDLPPRRGAPRTGTPGQPRMVTGRATACCLGWLIHTATGCRQVRSSRGPGVAPAQPEPPAGAGPTLGAPAAPPAHTWAGVFSNKRPFQEQETGEEAAPSTGRHKRGRASWSWNYLQSICQFALSLPGYF